MTWPLSWTDWTWLLGAYLVFSTLLLAGVFGRPSHGGVDEQEQGQGQRHG